LAERDEAAAWVEPVIDRLLKAKLIDDQTFAETKALVLFRQGRPPGIIRRRLGALGVGEMEIDTALAALCDDNKEMEIDAARTLVRRRRLGHFRPLEKREEFRQKDLSSMARAGFSFDVARRALAGEESD
jgi:regulatory protein